MEDGWNNVAIVSYRLAAYLTRLSNIASDSTRNYNIKIVLTMLAYASVCISKHPHYSLIRSCSHKIISEVLDEGVKNCCYREYGLLRDGKMVRDGRKERGMGGIGHGWKELVRDEGKV